MSSVMEQSMKASHDDDLFIIVDSKTNNTKQTKQTKQQQQQNSVTEEDDAPTTTTSSSTLSLPKGSESSKCSLSSSSSEHSDQSNESSSIYTSFISALSKPHKANDSRWEVIQAAHSKEGALGLNHFRLLKRLGCGDIGSVYLAEIRGHSGKYFAMKVMDKASLDGRKKILRAQTEREILQCLDHPFLPSLYTHFETDKFSCLVMEFCPGGDLHMLRQKQPGRHFAEMAAK